MTPEPALASDEDLAGQGVGRSGQCYQPGGSVKVWRERRPSGSGTGYVVEVGKSLDALLAKPDGGRVSPIRAKALIVSIALVTTFDYRIIRRRIEEALDFARGAEDAATTALVLRQLSWLSCQ